MQNKSKFKILFLHLLGWLFGALFMIIGFILIIEPAQNNLTGLSLVLISWFLLPPIRKVLAKKSTYKLSIKTQIALCLAFFTYAALTTNTKPYPTSKTESENYKNLEFIIAILEDDFINMQKGSQTIISEEMWYSILEIQGSTSADKIMQDFKDNEVFAVQKYKGAWLINGPIRQIENSFDLAKIGLGKNSTFIHFTAEMNNKDRAAKYTKGQNITLYCEHISEYVTIVNGSKCRDYNDWKDLAFKNAINSAAKIQIDLKGQVMSLSDILTLLDKNAHKLPHPKLCREEPRHPKCLNPFKVLGNQD